MTRILHVVQSLDPAWGGMARVVPELATHLSAAGLPSRITTLAGGRFGTPPGVVDVDVISFSDAGTSRLGRSPNFNREIKRLVAECDVVHLHGLWTGQNLAAGRAARRLGKPYVITPHSMMMPWAWKRSRWKKLLAGWLFEHGNLRGAARLHALADDEARHMRALGFNDRIVVIPNGLDAASYADRETGRDINAAPGGSPADPALGRLLARFPELAGGRWVLMLGRIAIQKGVIPAMQACFDVLSAGADWRLVMAGPDEFGLRRRLEAAVRRKGLATRVTFTGTLSHDEARAVLRRAAMLLQPSLSEGLSMSILEALASGLPVIISDACNMPEVAAADAGRIVAPQRRAVAAALKELITLDDAARAAMGRRGQVLVAERFDWKVVMPRYVEMYGAVAV